MKRFQNAGIAALTLLLSASITFNVISPMLEKHVLAYDSNAVLTSEEDLQAAQSNFEAYKESLIASYREYVSSYDPDDTLGVNATIDQWVDRIRSYPYDAGKSYSENVIDLGNYVSTLSDAVYQVGDIMRFRDERQLYADRLYDHITDNGILISDRVDSFLSDATSTLTGFPYDTSTGYDGNLRRLDACYYDLLSDLDIQVDMDRYDQYKESRISEIYSFIGSNPSDRITAYLDSVMNYLSDYPYNTERSLEENEADFDTFFDSVYEGLLTTSDIDSFEAYKEAISYDVLTYANSQGSPMSDRITAYLDSNLFLLTDYPYDEHKSLEENISDFDRYYQEFRIGLSIEMDKDSFDAYKESISQDVLSYVNTTPAGYTDRVRSFLDNNMTYLEDYPYDTSKSLTENIASFDRYYQSFLIDLSVEIDKDSFDAYKESLCQDVLSYVNSTPAGYTDRVGSFLDSNLYLLSDYPYDVNKSLDENISSVDRYYQSFRIDLSVEMDKDSFDAYKQSEIESLARILGTSMSPRITTYLYTVENDISNYPYNESKSFEDNRREFDTYFSEVMLELGMFSDMDLFDAYKEAQIREFSEYIGTDYSYDMFVYINSVSDSVSNYPYDPSKSLDENMADFDDYLAGIRTGADNIKGRDEFESTKLRACNILYQHAGTIPSSYVAGYLVPIIESIENLPYDDTKSADENQAVLMSMLRGGIAEIDYRVNEEEFDNYKQGLISDLMSTGISSYEDAASEIDAVEYNTDLAPEQNKAVLMNIVAAATTQEEPGSIVIFPSVDLEQYELLDGEGSEWTVGAEEGLTFRCVGAIDDFAGIVIDGEEIDPSLYTTYEGSTYCVLSVDLLESIATGEHVLVFVYVDGISEATHFTTTAVQEEATTTQNSASAEISTEASTVTTTAATTAATQATVLGEARTSEETTAATTTSETHTENTQVATNAPATSNSAAAAVTSTGETPNGTVPTGILLIAGATLILIIMNRKRITENN